MAPFSREAGRPPVHDEVSIHLCIPASMKIYFKFSKHAPTWCPVWHGLSIQCPMKIYVREWLTHQVVPALRDARPSRAVERPTLSVLDWPQMSLSMLHWQDEPWIRLRDMPCVLADGPFNRRESWWRKASRVLREF
jgi:hypothetical protein